MKYGYYVKIDKSFNLTDALDLLSWQKYSSHGHTFSRVYNIWKPTRERDYLMIHDNIFEPEYCASSDLELIIGNYSNHHWKWAELKLNHRCLGEL